MSIDVNCTAWQGFKTGEWRHLVNVRNFIQKNYTPYEGDDTFLSPISKKTAAVWDKASALIVEEIKKGKIEYRVDKEGNINCLIGKCSFTDEALVENYQALYGAIAKARPAAVKGNYVLNIVLSSTMGPGIKVLAD